MFVIREAIPDDAPTLLKMAKMVHSNNLPADADMIRSNIDRSIDSFAGNFENPEDCEFLFVLEDADTGSPVGTSLIISRVGTPARPHLYFHVRKREHYSTDLQTGHVHVTLQLCQDTSGMTEIGGLVLAPSYRGHKAKLGLLLSMIRFQYMALNPKYFSERLIAEMMAPLTPDSRNTLWEYLGRRFINLEYAEADRFCRQSKEFITSLFPSGEIYASLLPPEARNLIGKISPEAQGAKAMLESLGFKYRNHADPFDGGPYLEAKLSEVPLIQTTRLAPLGQLIEPGTVPPVIEGFVGYIGEEGYRAIRAYYVDHGGTVSITREEAEAIRAQPGDLVAVTPRPVNPNTGSNEAGRPQRTKAPPKKRAGLRKASP